VLDARLLILPQALQCDPEIKMEIEINMFNSKCITIQEYLKKKERKGGGQ